MVIAYTFVKSLSATPINSLLRLAVVAIGPLAWNFIILVAVFSISLFLGPLLGGAASKFPAVMAAISHTLAVVGYVGIFEFLWYLERWDISQAVLGIIAVIAVDRFLLKLFIAVFLAREFKNDHSNNAFWSGRWYGRGMGGHAFTQPIRELIVKTVEMSAFAADFMAAHLQLFLLIVPCLIPYFDVVHSVALFWLAPNKLIRVPIFSYKQRSTRRKIIAKYGILFALVFAFFVALVVLPVVFRSQLTEVQCAICNSI